MFVYHLSKGNGVPVCSLTGTPQYINDKCLNIMVSFFFKSAAVRWTLLSIFKYKNPYPRDFFLKESGLQGHTVIHGAGSAGRYSIVFLALAILLPAMTPTLEQDFTLFYALYYCRVNAI